MNLLGQHVRLCDRRIEKNKQKSEIETILSDDDIKKIALIQRNIQDLCDQSEVAANENDLEKAWDLVKQIEQLKDAAAKIAFPLDEKRKTVCDVSGNYMSSRYGVLSYYSNIYNNLTGIMTKDFVPISR